MLAQRIPEIQSALAEAGLDGWFFACFQRNDPIGIDPAGAQRRGQAGQPPLLLPGAPAKGSPGSSCTPSSPACWTICPAGSPSTTPGRGTARGWRSWSPGSRLAAQYSPNNELPTVSRLDAGTAELLRAAGRRGGLLRRPGAAVRRHLERRAARRAPPRQRPPAPDRPRGVPRVAEPSGAATRSTSTPCSAASSTPSSSPACGPSATRSSASTRTAPTRTTSRAPATPRRSAKGTSC